uniref:PAN domain protein n=1 Tax=Elaeophora elaphi TaxID=1147741 RepID=A0A158Q8Q1_9BILA
MKCTSRNKIIYVRSEGYYSTGKVQAVFQDLTLLECANQCTTKAQGANCTLFEYDTVHLRCILKEDSGSLMDDNILPLKTVPNIALFQQLCLPEEEICPSSYTFERLPGHILMGIADEVKQVGSVEECLSICLSAKKEIEMECRSVMYYYDTGECILNDKDRATSAALITNDTMNMRVDYFENICFDVQCSADFTVHWIKVRRFIISRKLDTVVKQVTKEQCFNYCLKNKIDDRPFPCKLYAYSEDRMICHLTSESGLTYSAIPDDIQNISDNSENYDYYEKICLKGSIRCQDSSFEHVSNHALSNTGNKVETTSMMSCLEICLRSGKQCSSVMFFHEKDECVLSKTTQYSNNEQLRYISEVDYFDNVCDYRIAINMSMENKIAEIPISTMHRKLNGIKNLRLYEHRPRLLSFSDNLDPLDIDEHENLDLEAIHGRLETECGATGILISVLFSKPTVGAIFIKDHFATCRSEFSNTMNATMEIVLSTLRQDNPPCPGYETSPSTWSFIVVVQKNGLGIPGLMTDEDRVFNITCDYLNGQPTSDSAQDRVILQEESRDWSSIPASNDHVQLTVFRGDQPVSTAVMGEELEMRWTVALDGMGNVGLFVNRCIAERLDGTPPLPPPLTLIADGQFDGGLRTKIKVFRFDGSRRVRILCSVDICIEECLPVNCNEEASGSMTSSDKKKRETFTSQAQQMLAERTKREFTTGTFTIVEENVNPLPNENATKTDEQSLNQNMMSFQFPESSDFCVQSLPFFVLIAITLILLTMQIVLVCKYTRLKTQGSLSSRSKGSCDIISAPKCVYFGHEEYCPVKSRTTQSKIIRQKYLK